MQEAVKNVINFVFETLKLNVINAFTHKDNEKSTNLPVSYTHLDVYKRQPRSRP